MTWHYVIYDVLYNLIYDLTLNFIDFLFRINKMYNICYFKFNILFDVVKMKKKNYYHTFIYKYFPQKLVYFY